MRKYLTSDDICNQISMNRSLFKGTILLSEGNTDQRMFGKFIDKGDVKIIPAHSKDNVKSVINKMQARKDGKILGIIDRDLDEMKGKTVSPPLFYTDYRDMEMMLINSSALDQVLNEYADTERLERFRKQFGDVRDVLISSAYPLGLLMYVSFLRGYNLNFRDLNFRDFTERRSLSTDIMKMVQVVIDNTSGCELNRRNVVRDLNTQAGNHTDKANIARGHDTVDVLLIGLKETFGSYNASALNEGSLGGALRLSYSESDFASSELYKDTKRWADARGIRLWRINRLRSPLSLSRLRTP